MSCAAHREGSDFSQAPLEGGQGSPGGAEGGGGERGPGERGGVRSEGFLIPSGGGKKGEAAGRPPVSADAVEDVSGRFGQQQVRRRDGWAGSRGRKPAGPGKGAKVTCLPQAACQSGLLPLRLPSPPGKAKNKKIKKACLRSDRRVHARATQRAGGESGRVGCPGWAGGLQSHPGERVGDGELIQTTGRAANLSRAHPFPAKPRCGHASCQRAPRLQTSVLSRPAGWRGRRRQTVAGAKQ